MRRLTVILVSLTVAACGRSAKTTDPAAAFEQGVARLREHRNEIFGNVNVSITASDLKKTNSLPVVGMIKISQQSEILRADNDLRLAWHENSWKIRSFDFVIKFSQPGLQNVSGSYNAGDGRWVATQACFISDEKAAAAAKAMAAAIAKAVAAAEAKATPSPTAP